MNNASFGKAIQNWENMAIINLSSQKEEETI